MYRDVINYEEDHHLIIQYDEEHSLSHEIMVTLREDTWITNNVIDLYVEIKSICVSEWYIDKISTPPIFCA